MAAGTLNISKILNKQGLDPHIQYEAEVVNNNDPRQLGRIQARIKTIFDGIEDADLPWAIPLFSHADGAYNDGSGGTAGDLLDRSGTFFVPKEKHKVSLRFPKDGSPYMPIWTSYTVDEQTALPETRKNYPDRAVLKFSNGAYIIIDTKTNEIFFNNPGDMDITVLGDVNQYIHGNQQLVVTDQQSDIPSYLLNAPDTVLKRLRPQPTKNIQYTGLMKKTRQGNQHTMVRGDRTIQVHGDQKVEVFGNNTLRVHKNSSNITTGLDRTQAARVENN